jgi:hypothetical protein
MIHKRLPLLFVAALAGLLLPLVATAQVQLPLSEPLFGTQGCTVGPDGALYLS